MKKDTNKVKKDKKIQISKENIKIIIIIFMIISIVVIGTYALSLWTSSENTELTMRIGSVAEVVFETGNDINVENIGPVFDPEEDGEITNFAVINLTAEEVPIIIDFKLTSISDNLKSKNFKCVLMGSDDNGATYTKINEINFETAVNNKSMRLSGDYTLPVNNTARFKVIFYIDGNSLNSNLIQGGSLSGFIQVKAGILGDVVIENIPIITGPYVVDVSDCTDVTMTYDYAKKGFRISNMSVSENAICVPEVTSTTRTTLAQYIISLLGTGTSVSATSKGDGSTLEKITDNSALDYRYRGINPNNYVLFNDELWRIIGVFDQNTHGITNKNLVKLIRNDTLGAFDWNPSADGNNFPTSAIYKILNRAYFNSLDATGESYCFTKNVAGKCNFTGIGLKPIWRNMVEMDANWFLGGYSSISINSKSMYVRERGTAVYTGNNVSTSEAGAVTPVGLMYISDYGYAAPSSCTAYLNAYSNAGCSNLNWIKRNYSEWSLTHQTSTTNIILSYIHPEGKVANSVSTMTNSGFDVRPVLYLKENVFKVSGSGTQMDPYVIAMD